MTPHELTSMILAGTSAECASRAAARRNAIAIFAWLAEAAASPEGLFAPSSRNVARYRQTLRRAGLAPIEAGGDLAEIAQALGVRPRDRDALARLGWALRGPTGRLAFADYPHHFDRSLDRAQEALEFLEIPQAA